MSLTLHDLDGPVLWEPTLGRGFRWHEPLDLSSLPKGVQLRIQRWGTTLTPVSAVWCRHRACLAVPGGIWAPDPTRTSSSGPPYRLIALTEQEAALWAAVNDGRTGRDLAKKAGVSPRHLGPLAAKLTAIDAQALQLRTLSPNPRDPSLRRLVGRARAAHERTPDQYDANAATTLTQYHQQAIVDARTQFDDRETTFAHAFGVPHPAFGGERFGERLRSVLRARGWPADGPVLEVGCGTGELAAAWGQPDEGVYRRIDLSPALLAAQQEQAPWSVGEEGDITALSLPDNSVPLLLSNEVLADLEAVPVARATAEVHELREQLGLAELPAGHYNPGAWRAICEAARVLTPGGRALFTEFGEVDAPVLEAEQLDHPEVAIHFGQLAHAAASLGLHAELVRLDSLMQPDPTASWIARHSWLALRSWAHSEGIRLPARAYTPRSLQEALSAPVSGVDWVPLTHEGPGPLMTRFWALLLTKPA